ncbi:MAG: DUF547 domain-containing protein [Acidimicrobiia bacterium]
MSKSSTSPNVLRAGLSIVLALVKVRAPDAFGFDSVSHDRYASVLDFLHGDVVRRLPDAVPELDRYLAQMETVEPEHLGRDEALAFWINLYNAAGLRLGATAAGEGAATVFGIPGAFTTPVVTIAGEALSLDQIEHGKIRRFKDPRIHAGLVCGAMSCPTLRREPYTGDVDGQLDDQMRQFLADGAIRVVPSAGEVMLSPIFSWFGRDFVSPHRMPTFLPARRRTVLGALTPWLDDETALWIEEVEPSIRYTSYDWGLGCAIG